jgi:hypothetical protein
MQRLTKREMLKEKFETARAKDAQKAEKLTNIEKQIFCFCVIVLNTVIRYPHNRSSR